MAIRIALQAVAFLSLCIPTHSLISANSRVEDDSMLRTRVNVGIPRNNGTAMNSFSEQLKNSGFDLEKFLDKDGWPKRNSDVTRYLELLMFNRDGGPSTPPKVTQRPVPLESPAKCDETGYFTGPRATPAHVVMITTLAFELDILEATLYELDDVVDEFVVFEGLYTQRGARKPQMFLNNKGRFAPFMDKIRYYQQLPSELGFKPTDVAPKGQNWINEGVRKLAYDRYVTEQRKAGQSLNNTLFVNADGDEIPPAVGLQRFKYCNTDKLWASFCAVTYEADHGHIEEKKDGCGKLGHHYWPFPNILREGEPLRDHEHHKNMYDELPGVHMHARDPWSYLARYFTTAEKGKIPEVRDKNAHMLLDPDAIYRALVCEQRKKTGMPRSVTGQNPILESGKVSFEAPKLWFMAANEERFPYLDPGFVSCGVA